MQFWALVGELDSQIEKLERRLEALQRFDDEEKVAALHEAIQEGAEPGKPTGLTEDDRRANCHGEDTNYPTKQTACPDEAVR